MLDRSDPRHAKIDAFEASVTAFAETLGIEFEMSERMRSDILTAAEQVPIDDVIADITARLRVQFAAIRKGALGCDDAALDLDITRTDQHIQFPTLQ